MTKPAETQVHAPAKRVWVRPAIRKIDANAAETGGASPQTDLGVTFS
jgi:hypothetical protein